MMSFSENFDKNIRPLIDAVDTLRGLKVTQEGITLPTIVVVGDQSSGKSSVLESLATISLPRGLGIATRVPLILQLQRCPTSKESSVMISYKNTRLSIREDEIESQINEGTNVLAGIGKGVKDLEITLHIRKPNVPDLTMIDLPGITRVPIKGQPANIYEQISAMIRKYLKPKETIILNVLAANVDFATCESIKMSQEADKNGERTLAVVTKVDKAPEDVYDKVMADDVNIGLGYICVRNRTGDVSHEEAREQERQLFKTHPSLSRLDQKSVGIQALAERLMQILAKIIRTSLPGIQQKVDKALLERQRELEALPVHALDGEHPTAMFLDVVNHINTCIENIVLNGNYETVAEEKEMHYPARLDEMFRAFSGSLHGVVENIIPQAKTDEILLCQTEKAGVTLPNFLSPSLMRELVGEEIDNVSGMCTNLVTQSHDFAGSFVFNIIERFTAMFPKFHAAYRKEAEHMLATSRRKSMKYAHRLLAKEKSNVFTVNDLYMANIQKIRDHGASYQGRSSPSLSIEGFKRSFSLVETLHRSTEYKLAFDMKVNLAAYCKVVYSRMADEIPLELKYSIENAMVRNLRSAVLKANLGQDLSSLMEESASSLRRRRTLQKRVDMLKECKDVLSSSLLDGGVY